MLYAIECIDKEGALPLRLETRPAHLDYLQSLAASVVLAGPFQNEEGKPTGSLVIVRAESKADAEKIAAEDPYNRAGLFQSVLVRRWAWVINAPDTV